MPIIPRELWDTRSYVRWKKWLLVILFWVWQRAVWPGAGAPQLLALSKFPTSLFDSFKHSWYFYSSSLFFFFYQGGSHWHKYWRVCFQNAECDWISKSHQRQENHPNKVPLKGGGCDWYRPDKFGPSKILTEIYFRGKVIYYWVI